MGAGKYRTRATIQQSVKAKTAGVTTETWVDVVTVWCSIEPIRGREYFSSQQQQADITTRICMRYRPGIKPLTMRMVRGSQIFNLKSVINVDDRNRELELMCQEVV